MAQFPAGGPGDPGRRFRRPAHQQTKPVPMAARRLRRMVAPAGNPRAGRANTRRSPGVAASRPAALDRPDGHVGPDPLPDGRPQTHRADRRGKSGFPTPAPIQPRPHGVPAGRPRQGPFTIRVDAFQAPFRPATRPRRALPGTSQNGSSRNRCRTMCSAGFQSGCIAGCQTCMPWPCQVAPKQSSHAIIFRRIL